MREYNMAKKSCLRIAMDHDHHNFAVSEHHLGATALLADDLLHLYEFIGKAASGKRVPPTNDVALALSLLLILA